ncbi:hypothetical protein PV783_24965 [Chitinophaga sp. CC14]|uniref:hypothetical protein n=1 Tax=Chitinophaga sp. CC14 TaxID=3029199 RepID=UPI003B7C7F05
MKRINNYIDELSRYLQRKEYDGLFALGGKGPERLPDLLKGYMAMAFAEPMTLALPVKVSTITSLTDRKGRYTRCEFELDYNSKDGVHIKAYEFQFLREGEKYPLYRYFKQIKHRSEIPEKSRGIKMVRAQFAGSKKSLRL